MKTILLVGEKECGKTSSLYLAYEKIILCGGKGSNFNPEGARNQWDFSDIVSFQGMKIAFFTMGDFEDKIINAFNNYNSQNCDILICSCRNTFSKLISIIKASQHNIIDKTHCSNVLSIFEANIHDCDTILKLI
jgi:hypothetical protein